MVFILSSEQNIFNQPRSWLHVQNSANKVEKKRKRKTKNEVKT